MNDTKRKLMAIAGERLPTESLCPWQVRSAREADRAAIKEVTAWRKIWKEYVREHLTELMGCNTPSETGEWQRDRFEKMAAYSLTMFNTPGETNNNPFHVPHALYRDPEKRFQSFYIAGEVKSIYIGEWQRYWFSISERHRILQEALDRESARRRAKSRRVGGLTRNEIYVLKGVAVGSAAVSFLANNSTLTISNR